MANTRASEGATARWVACNNRRLHTSISDQPPAEYEAAYQAEGDGVSSRVKTKR